MTPTPEWSIATGQPADWHDITRDLGAGFFHDRNALTLGAPAGEPIIAIQATGEHVVGAAVGVRFHCRLSPRRRHAFFPSLPVLHNGADPAAALGSLCRSLNTLGVSDVVFDSFDAPSGTREAVTSLADFPDRIPGHDRHEYRVHLHRDHGDIARAFTPHHIRHVRRGERDGWRLELGTDAAAERDLAQVASSASARATARGSGFTASPWHVAAAAPLSTDEWGIIVGRAYDGPGLLAAALVGWGDQRAFYLGGGSTETGYAAGAAAWLHWRMMKLMRERGVSTYNLGGAPADAIDKSHPAHGLHRFKESFGAEIVALRGIQWHDGSLHASLHRAARHLTRHPDHPEGVAA